jgi:hypothetical protein
MKKIMKIFYESSKLILGLGKNFKYKKECIFVICVLFMLTVFINIPKVKQIVCIILYLVLVIFEIIFLSDKIMLSVTGFFRYGILYYFQLMGLIFILFCMFESNAVILMAFIYITAAVLWWGFSLLVNNKVGNLVNEILSAIMAVFVLIKDLIISIIPTDILNIEKCVTFMGGIHSYSFEKICGIVFNIIITPFLIINIMALLLCTIKAYWIEKYNNGKDITQDMMHDDKINNI